MQKIIDSIQEGTLTTKQLLDLLLAHDDQSTTEYNDLCTLAEKKDASLNEALEALAQRTEEFQKSQADLVQANKTNVSNVSVYNKLKAKYDTLVSDAIRIKEENKASKQALNENKALKKNKANQVKVTKQRELRITTLEREAKEYRLTIQADNTEIARLRLSGRKDIGDYAFSIFPSHVEINTEGVKEKRVALMAIHTKTGNMKIVYSNNNDEIFQPRSHNFKFNEEHKSFIRDFCAIARKDNHQFTDKILRLVN